MINPERFHTVTLTGLEITDAIQYHFRRNSRFAGGALNSIIRAARDDSVRRTMRSSDRDWVLVDRDSFPASYTDRDGAEVLIPDLDLLLGQVHPGSEPIPPDKIKVQDFGPDVHEVMTSLVELQLVEPENLA